MKSALLDTHTLLWFTEGDIRLGVSARRYIEDPTVSSYVSIASLWEIAVKVSIGKLALNTPLEEFLKAGTEGNGISVLPIKLEHLVLSAALPFHHRDPFDRLIVAQAIAEGMTLLSGDGVLDDYDIERLW